MKTYEYLGIPVNSYEFPSIPTKNCSTAESWLKKRSASRQRGLAQDLWGAPKGFSELTSINHEVSVAWSMEMELPSSLDGF